MRMSLAVCEPEFGNITCLVEDLSDSERGFAKGPERSLMSALLFDGVQSYMCYLNACQSSKRSRFKESYLWVESRSRDYVFSFENVCDALGINSDFLRLGLANATHSQREALSKSRRHS